MERFTSTHKLRYHHMDRAGMVFHGAYVELFQDAFEDLMEHIGHVEKDLEPTLGVRLPVVEHRMGFPTHPHGDTLIIATHIERLGHASVTFRLTATDRDQRIVAEATVVRVCIGETGTSMDIPAPLREAWAAYAQESTTSASFGE